MSGKHFVDDFKDRLFVFIIELFDKPYLFYRGFIFDDHFAGYFTVIVDDLVGGHIKELRHFLEFFYGEGEGTLTIGQNMN